jgi:hypothetical protein
MCTAVHAADQDRPSTAAATSAAKNPRGRAPKLEPAAIKSSKLTVRLDWAGRAPSKTNLTSPVAAGSTLLLIDQGGWLDAWDGGTNTRVLLSATNLPAGISLIGPEGLLNVAANANGSRLYVMFTSSTVPSGIPQRLSPRPDANAWHVLYGFDFDGTALSNARAITALQVRYDGHTGGGLAMIDDSTLFFATGDSGDAGEDGRGFAQDPANHHSKIVGIDVATGATEIAAIGVRNVQHLIVDANNGDPHLVAGDIGGWIAEEIDAVRVEDLLAGVLLNFGWGRNADDTKAREGTFYIDATGTAVGAAPIPEPGFVQPVAQFGREGADFVAITGPVASPQSFNRIRYLLGDLVSGSVYALTAAPTTIGQSVSRIALVDSASRPVTLKTLAGGGRPDPRFFNFTDGTAGVLLEATGDFFRLTEVR